MVNFAFAALGFGKKIVSWEGFRSWKFWAGLFAAITLSWVLLTNNHLNNKVNDLALENKAAEHRIELALNKNDELNLMITRMTAGAVIDQGVLVTNQQELDRMRNEHEEREREINAQTSSGPAGNATVCAITGVCQR